MRKLLVSLAVVGAAFLPAASMAATTFNFLAQVPGIGGSFIQASGTLTCASDLDANNSCVATGITGTVSNPLVNSGAAQAINGLSFYNGADQKLIYYPTNPNYPFHADLTVGGLSFTTSSAANPNGLSYNFFSLGLDNFGRLRMRETNDGLPGLGLGKIGVNALFQLDLVTSVPEPANWALMISGFGLVGGALRRSRPSLSLA